MQTAHEDRAAPRQAKALSGAGVPGHAIESRINAEDPDDDFFRSPGEGIAVEIPGGPGAKVDAAVLAGARSHRSTAVWQACSSSTGRTVKKPSPAVAGRWRGTAPKA